jgi:hypothetical protein
MLSFDCLRFTAGAGDMPTVLWIVTWPGARLFQESF